MAEKKEKKIRSARPFQILRKIEVKDAPADAPENWTAADLPEGLEINSTSKAIEALKSMPAGRYAIVQLCAVKTVKVVTTPTVTLED